MKHLKNFNELLYEGKKEIGSTIDMKELIIDILKIFELRETLSEILSDDLIGISDDIYNTFIDISRIMILSEDDIQDFADGLGVGGEDDNLIAILNKLYIDKTKRVFGEDVELCIDELKQYLINNKNKEVKKYLTLLEKINDNL